MSVCLCSVCVCVLCQCVCVFCLCVCVCVSVSQRTSILTMHLVGLLEVLIVLLDCLRGFGELFDVVVQIPAQVLIEHRGQEVKLFVEVSLKH